MLSKMMKTSTAIGFLIVAVGLAMPQAANAQTCHPAPVQLVSWWAGDGNVLDSRNRNNGTLIGNAGFAAGKVGQAFNLDGIDDSVQIPHDNNQNINGSFSAEAWIFPRSFPNIAPRIFDKDTNVVGSPRWSMSLNHGGALVSTIDANINGGAALAPNNSITLNQWHHVAFSYNAATGELRLFINGALANSTNIGIQTVNTTAPLIIGDDSGTSTRDFDGLIDEPAIYNRTLSDTEIAAIHAAGTTGKCKPTATTAPSGQIAWWAGDGNANDISGSGSNGILKGGAGFAVGRVGQAFSLDGSNDSIDTSAEPNANLNFGANNFSIEAWVNFTATGTIRTVYGNGYNLNSVVTLLINSDSRARLQIRDSSGVLLDVTGTSALNEGAWHHIVGMRQGTTAKLFVDGVQQGGDVSNAAFGSIDSICNFAFIGGFASDGACASPANSAFFNGLIDEVSVYNRALTQDEITSIFNAGLAGKLKQGATPTGANVSTNVGSDATINFSSVSTAGTTQQIPLDPTVLPALPGGFTSTGLFYDIASSASFTGNSTVCFNLPSINSQPTFSQLKVLHLESGTWIDRTTGQNFTSRTLCGQVSSFSPFAIAGGSTPTSAGAYISGQVTTPDGTPLGGVLVTLSGAKSAWTLTDSKGTYRFEDVDTDNFYTVTPGLQNYSFSPANRSFSLLGNHPDAGFTAVPNTAPVGNAIDTSEFFVRQQYLDFLGREPDQGGLEYWNQEIARCGNDTACVNKRRIDVSASFFMAREFQETGAFVYGLYKASFGNQPSYKQFTADRAKVVGGLDLDARKNALAAEWVLRASFRQAYPDSMSSEQFVNKLFESAGLVPHTGEWETYVLTLNNGGTRAQVLRSLISNPEFTAKEYNATFVLMEYFAYLRRDPDPGGYAFWLNVLDNREPGNYRGMVCSFITSTEYQKRFGSLVTHNNAECAR